MTGSIQNPFDYKKYLIQKKFISIGTFHIYGPMGQSVLLVDKKLFKLKEDIRIFSDETRSMEILNIQARKILDFSAAYDVFDSRTGEKVGVLKRRGFRSMVKDSWIIMDAGDNDIGEIAEDNMTLALLRRLATNLIPQSFEGTLKGMPVFSFRQHFNPFLFKMELDFTADQTNQLDRRLGLAAGILLASVEGRQD